MSTLGVCPACESSNGHSFSCPILMSRESTFDSESYYVNYPDWDDGAYDYDISDDMHDFDSYQDSDSDYDDDWVQEAYDELDAREDSESDWEPDEDENFQALVQLKARIRRRDGVGFDA